MSRAILAALAVVALLLTGCGSSTRTGGTGGPSTSGPPDALSFPRGSDQLVLRVNPTGGFLPVEAIFSTLPNVSLMGDGRLIAPGPVIAIYPGPASTPLWAQSLTETGVQRVLQAARDAGLTEDLGDLGNPPVADASSTEITLAVGDRRVVNSIYALEVTEGAGSGVTEAQARARERVADFLAKLGDVESWLGDDAAAAEPYDFQALAVQFTEAGSRETAPPDVTPNELAWPLDDLATLGATTAVASLPQPPAGLRQALITGDELENLRPLLDQATQITVWTSGGKKYVMGFRPLLPDEVPR